MQVVATSDFSELPLIEHPVPLAEYVTAPVPDPPVVVSPTHMVNDAKCDVAAFEIVRVA
jgi:hypothetical protein